MIHDELLLHGNVTVGCAIERVLIGRDEVSHTSASRGALTGSSLKVCCATDATRGGGGCKLRLWHSFGGWLLLVYV